MKKLIGYISILCFSLVSWVVADETENKWSGLLAAASGNFAYKTLTKLEENLGALPIEGCEWGMKFAIFASPSEVIVKSVILKKGKYYYIEDTLSKIGNATRKVTVNPKLKKSKLRKLPKIQELSEHYNENKFQYTGIAHTQYVYFEWCPKRKIWLSQKMPQKKVGSGFYDRISTFLSDL